MPTQHYAQFFTATILEWKKLLQPEKYKNIIINSLQFLVHQKRAYIYAYVIMDNHIHIIWQAREGYSPQDIQHSLLKFTAQQIKFDLLQYHPNVLQLFKVNAADREYQFWERNPLGISLFSLEVFKQKMMYIHNNPVTAGYCKQPEDYNYSSAQFYFDGHDAFGFLTHWQQ